MFHSVALVQALQTLMRWVAAGVLALLTVAGEEGRLFD